LGIKCHEALVLVRRYQSRIVLTHGHQLISELHRLENQSVFMVRIMETITNMGISDPTSPAKIMERIKLNSASKWIENNGRKITIVGHTHSLVSPIPA
jgi:predicted phosphodiesterase